MERRYLVWLMVPVVFLMFTRAQRQKRQPKQLVYLPLGDSYTICTGATEAESWPVCLTLHLQHKGVPISMAINPAKNGYTTQNLIDFELPVCRTIKPDFVTLLIGVNDWVRGVSEQTYSKQLHYIIEEIEKSLANNGKLLLVTIPDFGVTPGGKQYANGRNISEGIHRFNQIIMAEAKKKHLPVADVFTLSKQMGGNKNLVAKDGLHPSAAEYAIWENAILPVAYAALK